MSEIDSRYLNSDELLEKIFHYMDKLFLERELSKTLTLLTDLGRTLVNSDRASFWFWDKLNKELWTMAASGINKISIPEDSGLVGASIKANQVLIVNDPYNDSRFNSSVDKASGYVTKSILVMPITNSDGAVIGAYQAINKISSMGNDQSFNEQDVKRLSLATAFCGRTLESYLLYNEALLDQLTGLKNRRGLHSHYEKCVVPSLQTQKSAIVMCDIDHFKNVNDTWGHNAGDAVLKHVAKLFSANIGIDDGVFRWGGEEFIFLLSNKTLAEAVQFAEQMRQIIENSVCKFENYDLKITMSFGVRELDGALTTEENVKKVDEKLYYAKEHGRNCVIS